MNSYNRYNRFSKPVKKRKLKISKKSYLILLAILLIAGSLYYFLFISVFFNITEVSTRGLIEADVSRMNDAFSEKLTGKKIFLVRGKLMEDFVALNSPDYKYVGLTKIYPGKLIIEIEKREPQLVVQAINGTFLIDKANFVMGSTSSFLGYSTSVEYDKALELGKPINDSTLVSSFKYAGSYGIVFVKDNIISVELNNGGKVLLPVDLEASAVEKLSITLQKIIQKYTIENKEINTIDLRFSKPLVRYK